MTPLDIIIAFGGKLKAVKQQEIFDPTTDEEFQLLLAYSQQCYKLFEDRGFIVPLDEFNMTKEQMMTKVQALIEKYQ